MIATPPPLRQCPDCGLYIDPGTPGISMDEACDCTHEEE